MDTLVVVITDQSGNEVFRDDYVYSTRHGVGVTWLSDHDQLWILSADVGHSYVEVRDGRWTKVDVTPETTVVTIDAEGHDGRVRHPIRGRMDELDSS